MVKGTFPSFVKSALLCLNFHFLIGGVTCVVLGLMVLLDKPILNVLLNLDTGSTNIGMITASAVITVMLGAITIIFAILGCCGAGRESKILLGVYIGILILLLVVQLVSGALAAAYRTETEAQMRNWMIEKIKSDYDGRGDTKRAFGKALDFAQVEFECCGINNYTDFKVYALNWAERDSRAVPLACCKLNKDEFYNRNLFIVNNITCAVTPRSEITNISEPCFNKIREHLMIQALYLILIAFLLITLEVFVKRVRTSCSTSNTRHKVFTEMFLAVVMACFLMRTIKDTVV